MRRSSEGFAAADGEELLGWFIYCLQNDRGLTPARARQRRPGRGASARTSRPDMT